MSTVRLSISGMSCGHCVASVRSALEAVPGVQVEQVRIGAAVLRLDDGATDATAAAIAALDEAGYPAAVADGDAASSAPEHPPLTALVSRRTGGARP
jgi:copper chaperone CopZ